MSGIALKLQILFIVSTFSLNMIFVLLEIRFQCMGSWRDEDGNMYSAVADLGEEIFRERFRCMVRK